MQTMSLNFMATSINFVISGDYLTLTYYGLINQTSETRDSIIQMYILVDVGRSTVILRVIIPRVASIRR